MRAARSLIAALVLVGCTTTFDGFSFSSSQDAGRFDGGSDMDAAGPREGGVPSDARPDAPGRDTGPRPDAGPVCEPGECVVDIESFDNHTCVLLDGGRVWCWGANQYGQLGNGMTGRATTPTLVMRNATLALEDVTHIAVGARGACARTDAGLGASVFCWGVFEAMGSSPYAQDETSLTGDASEVTYGERHTCVITGTEVRCAGVPGVYLAHMSGMGDYRAITLTAPLPSPLRQISAGVDVTCISTNEQLRCWGENTAILGELTPPASLDLGAFDTSVLSVGVTHACLIADTRVHCFGSNAVGQLNGTPGLRSDMPMMVATSAEDVDVGPEHTCAAIGGVARCWGGDSAMSGRLGPGLGSAMRTAWTPTDGAPVTHVAVGRNHSCAMSAAQEIRCWGTNAMGQRGGDMPGGPEPQRLPTPWRTGM